MRVALLSATSALFVAAVLSAACGKPADTPLAPPLPPPTATTPPPAAPVGPPITLAQTGINASWMDTSVDPCTDYFAYACGGFVKTTEIPADRPAWGTTSEIEKQNEEYLKGVLEKAAASPGSDPVLKKIGDYYASCMDEPAIEKAGVTPIKPLLADVAKISDFKSLATAIAKLHTASIFPLFDVSARQDFKDATHMIAMLDQNGLGLPDRDYYLKDEGNTAEVRSFYNGHVSRMLKLAGVADKDLKAATDDVLRIEKKIATLQQDKVTRRDPYKVYHRVDRDGLPKVAKTFPWDSYFKEIGIPGAKEVAINDQGYFTGIDALLHEEPPAAWKHYLTWQVIHGTASVLDKAVVDENFALTQKLRGQKELAPRWKRCIRSTDDALGELLAQPYVKDKFAGDSKPRAKALVTAIHEAMGTDLKSLAWMDDETRAAALTKLGKINDKVGYPDKWRSYDFDVTRSGYAKNALAGQLFESKRQLKKIGQPVDKTEWSMTPPTVNAYYDPSLNEIVVPAGELQPPFFSKDFYTPVNIGDEGANTIGHELTHGFDDEGSQFDGDGNLRDWWTKGTKAKFEAATKCVQDQYSSYDAVPGVKLNGELTSGENIADIGGVKLGLAALAAWQKAHPDARRSVAGFTDEQLFFLGYAQGWCEKDTPQFLEMLARTNPHAPAKWRVNGPMADNQGFATAYACKAGTPLNNGKACSVW